MSAQEESSVGSTAAAHADMKPAREHIAAKECWCEPQLDYVNPETGQQVWVHNEVH